MQIYIKNESLANFLILLPTGYMSSKIAHNFTSLEILNTVKLFKSSDFSQFFSEDSLRVPCKSHVYSFKTMIILGIIHEKHIDHLEISSCISRALNALRNILVAMQKHLLDSRLTYCNLPFNLKPEHPL
jgi:hypothetical protein